MIESFIELQENFTRLRADFDNYKKRVAKESLELSNKTRGELLKEFLPILDDIDRAINSSDNPDEGFLLIQRKIELFLKSSGVSKIPALGEEFDLDYHEAIGAINGSSCKIIEVIQEGYMYGSSVLRYSKVLVGNGDI